MCPGEDIVPLYCCQVASGYREEEALPFDRAARCNHINLNNESLR